MELLTFHVGDREFGVELDRVGEIIPPPAVTRVPGTAPSLVGVAPLRGEPIPVVDGGLRLVGTPIERSGRTPIVVLRAQRDGQPLRFGLVVHAAGRKLDVERLLPWDGAQARLVAADACVGFAESDGALIVVVDADRLLDLPEGPALPAPASIRDANLEPPRPEPEPVAPASRAVPDVPARSAASTVTSAAPPPPAARSSKVIRAFAAAHPAPRSEPSRARPTRSIATPPPAPHLRSVRPAFSPQPAVPAQAPLSPRPAGTSARPQEGAQAARAAMVTAPPSHLPARAAEPPRPLAPPPPAAPDVAPAHRSAPVQRRSGWLVAGAAIGILTLLGVLALRGGDPSRAPRATATAAPAPQPSASAAATAESAVGLATASQPASPSPFATAPAPAPAAANPAATASAAPRAVPAVPSPLAQAAAAAPASPVKAAIPTRTAPEKRAAALPPSMVVTPTTPPCEIHVVKKGDTLWWISAHKLGDPLRWPELFGENRRVIADPNVIEVHDRIRIPGACEPRAGR